MRLFNPKTWFVKKIGDHIFAKVDPAHPHGGLDHFSESDEWPLSIRIDGVTLAEARLELCGKVLCWEKMTDGQMKDLQKKKLRFTHQELKAWFR